MCEKGYNVSYSQDKHYGAKAYSIENDVQQIQAEIMKNGPVEADFTVYADFPTYKSGIYLILFIELILTIFSLFFDYFRSLSETQ